jgi:hypothetical protein
MLEHLLHVLIEDFDVLIGLAGQCIARGAAPDQIS